jgi:serine/threonine-protein kinase
MTGRLPFEGEMLGDIVLKVCAAPLPLPSRLNPNLPAGLDAWFLRACSRDPARRFQTADELAQSLAGVCGISHLRVATLDEDQVRYVMRPMADSDDLDEPLPPNGMSARTALLAGLVLGIAMMVGVLGFLAWRNRTTSPTESSEHNQPVAPSRASP